MTDAPASPPPGETVPPARRLARPPGDRYRTAVPEVVMEHPHVARALLLGAGAGLVIALMAAILHAVLSNAIGGIALSVLGGWLIGIGVRTGAWSGRPHRPSAMPLALAAGLGLATWVAGLILAWLVSMAILPASSMSFLDRVGATPFLDWVVPQLGAMDLLRLVLLVGVAWVTAHTTALERPAS